MPVAENSQTSMKMKLDFFSDLPHLQSGRSKKKKKKKKNRPPPLPKGEAEDTVMCPTNCSFYLYKTPNKNLIHLRNEIRKKRE